MPDQRTRAVVFIVLFFIADSTRAVVFPHRDLSDGDARGVPRRADFGTIVETGSPFADLDADSASGLPPELEGDDETVILASSSDALDEGLTDDAVRLGEDQVAAAVADHGIESREYAWALSALGAAYVHDGQPELALEPLRLSVAVHHQVQGVFVADLAGVHAYLGLALQELGQHREAMDEFSRAQSITHRHEGALNMDQLDLLTAKANSLMAMGEWWQAEQVLRAKVRITRHNYGADSLEVLEPMLELARWLTDSGAFRPALSVYREALQLQQDAEGGDTPAMVEPMRRMAIAFLLQQQYEIDRGLSLHKRIVAITEAHPEAFSLDERVRARLDLGDWFILFQREEQGWAEYAKARELATEDPRLADAVDAMFSSPQLIYAGPPLSVDYLGYRMVGKPQWNEFEFRVRRDGRPSHVKIRESNLHMTKRRQAINNLREARFRPAMVDGEVVEIERFALRRVYNTDPPPDYGVIDIGGERHAAPSP